MMFRIFLTNLGKYNEGEVVGKWVDLPCDDFKKELLDIGVDGKEYEEYFITDYDIDGLGYDDLGLGEYENLTFLNKLAEILEEVADDNNLEWAMAYYKEVGGDIMHALENYEDNSTWYPNMTLLDIAHEIVGDCYDLPDIAQRYFDYEAFARDLGYDSYIECEDGTLYLM